MKPPVQAVKVAADVATTVAESSKQVAATSFGSLVESLAARRAVRGRKVTGQKLPEVSEVIDGDDYDLKKLDRRLRRLLSASRKNGRENLTSAATLVQRHLDANEFSVTDRPAPLPPPGSRLPPVVYQSQAITALKASQDARAQAYTSSILLLLSQPNFTGISPAMTLCQRQMLEGVEPNIKVVTAVLHTFVNMPASETMDVAPVINLALQAKSSQSLDMQVFTLVVQLMITRCGAAPEHVEELVRDCMASEGWQQEKDWPLDVWDLLMSSQKQCRDLPGALGVFKRYRAALDARGEPKPDASEVKIITALAMPYMTLLSLYLDIRNSFLAKSLPASLRATLPNLPHIITEDLKSRLATPPLAYLNLLFSAQRQAGDVDSALKLWEILSRSPVESSSWINIFKLYRLQRYHATENAPSLKQLASRFLEQKHPDPKTSQSVSALLAAALYPPSGSLSPVVDLELVISSLRRLQKYPSRHLIDGQIIDTVVAAVIRHTRRDPILRNAAFGDASHLGRPSRWSKQDGSGVTTEEWRMASRTLTRASDVAISLPLAKPLASVHSVLPPPSLTGLASVTHSQLYPSGRRASARTQDAIKPVVDMLERVLVSRNDARSPVSTSALL